MQLITLFKCFVGVRIIPEFDAPAHVGYGWQYPGAEDFTVCLGKQPWYVFSKGNFFQKQLFSKK